MIRRDVDCDLAESLELAVPKAHVFRSHPGFNGRLGVSVELPGALGGKVHGRFWQFEC